jgi:hypothetical protein
MKYLRRFNENSEKSIEDWCKEFNIKDYRYTNNAMDVKHNVSINNKNMEKLPFKFDIIYGYFYCGHSGLKTLENCPNVVNGDFNCSDNELSSLKGGPNRIKGDYNCSNNKLIRLVDHLPVDLSGEFICTGNPVYNIYKLFSDYDDYRDGMRFNSFFGKEDYTIIKRSFNKTIEAFGDNGGTMIPDSIPGYRFI